MKKRIPAIDLARCCAILCVILTHATEIVYDLFGKSLFHAPAESLYPAVAFHALGRLGVPIFLYLSGYLLLDREYTEEKRIHFWKRNAAGLLITTEVWIIVYYFLMLWVNESAFSAETLIQQMLFLRVSSINHLWYMGMIIGIYLFLPFIAGILQKLDRKSLFFLLVVSCFFTFVTPTWNVFRDIAGQDHLAAQMNVNFSGGWPGILLILGWMIKRGYFDRIKSRVLAAVSMLSYLGVVLLDIHAYRNEVRYDIWYDSIFIVISALSLTILILRRKKVRHPAAVTYFGYSSFAVYLIHNGFIQIFGREGKKAAIIMALPGPVRVLLLVAAALLCSLALIWLLSRNKKMARILFFMK